MSLYKTSVLIWFCILFATLFTCSDLIKKNGWVEDRKEIPRIEAIAKILAMSCIPVFRFLICVVSFYLAGRKKKDNQ